MPLSTSPQSTSSLSTLSSVSSGSSNTNLRTLEGVPRSLPEPAVPKRTYARDHHARTSAPPVLDYHYDTASSLKTAVTNTRRKHISLPVDPEYRSDQSASSSTERSSLLPKPSGCSVNSSSTGGHDKSPQRPVGSKNFDFSYRNVYITPGAASGMGRARVGNGSGVPAGNCVLM